MANHHAACDQCHRLKMRCLRDPGQIRCARCTRVGHTCSVQRAVQPRGRPSSVARPPHTSPDKLIWVHNHRPLTLPLRSPLSGQHRPSDEALIASMSSVEAFLSYFILGPHFSSRFQSDVHAPLSSFPDLLREGCLACAGAVFQARTKKSGIDNVNFAHSAAGLRKLRCTRVKNGNIGALVSLGLALATFDLLMSGAATRTITRFTLSLTCASSPSVESIWMDPNLESDILCLVFMDTVECMFHRELPVMRYWSQNASFVHRLFGLCGPLLSIMCDVCKLAFESQSRSLSPRQLCPAMFDHLYAVVASWQPQPPPNFEATFSSQEVTCLLTQASVFRAAVLLVLHRLEYPFGIEDQSAAALSAGIMAECAYCASIVYDEVDKLPQTLFPWMIAAFEVTASAERETLMRMELSKNREILELPASKMKECIRFVWERRDADYRPFLFDLFEQAPTCLAPI